VPPDPAPASAPRPPATTAQPRPPATGGGNARALLRGGDLAAAARAFQGELAANAASKFTLALGIYCNEENAGRLVANASGSSEIYVLPASVEGRSCYRVTWGLYDSRDAAEAAVPSIPNGVRGGDVAPVAVSRFLR
jgi:septal ring-binding cell division protein DamX